MELKKWKKVLVCIFLAAVLLVCSLGILYFLEKNYFLLGNSSYFLYEKTKNSIDFLDQGKISDTVVYSDYYTWWDEKNWQRGASNKPCLGFYNSLDPEVLESHRNWANKYGIDVFKVEYIPDLDESIQEGIASHDLGGAKFCLMYDTMLRFSGTYGNPPYDFDNEGIYNLFIKDMDHIAETYFGNKNYFHLNGKPVLWIYVARDITGNFSGAISEIRKNFKNKGYGVYIVGDQVFWNYDFSGTNLFDAVSLYHAYAGYPQNTADFADRLKLLYMVWKTAAYINGVDFIPGAIFEYDDTCFKEERESIPVLSGEIKDFKYMLEMVSTYLDPVNGNKNLDQVTIATFNENQEGSAIEPSHEWGYSKISLIPKYFGKN